MQQVTEWLEKLGLGQYAQRFAENDISFSVLSDLTDQDLKEIGVSLGHRRQLLRAITELTGRAAVHLTSTRFRKASRPGLIRHQTTTTRISTNGTAASPR
jgi:SAM domain (Sterile alpha motif)